jgi:hypothetical protein
MKINISLIEDRGISKTLHFNTLAGNQVKGYVTVREDHPWYNKEVGEDLFLTDVDIT